MYSSKYFQDIKLNTNFSQKLETAICISLAATCGIIFLKYVLRRRKYSTFPGRPMRWTNFWGSIRDLMFLSKYKSLSMNVYSALVKWFGNVHSHSSGLLTMNSTGTYNLHWIPNHWTDNHSVECYASPNWDSNPRPSGGYAEALTTPSPGRCFLVEVSEKKLLHIKDFLQVLAGYNQLFKDQKLFTFWLSYIPVIVLTQAEAVEDSISGTKHMEKYWAYEWLHPWLGTGLLTSHGSKWKSRRKLLTPSFHFEILKDFLPIFNEQSQLLVKQLEKETEKPWIDITKIVTLCSLDIVCETTLGVSVGAQKNSESEYVQAVLRASEVFMKRVINPFYFFDWLFWLSSVGIQFRKDIKLLHNFTRTVIFDKKQKLLSVALENERKKRKALIDLLLEEHVLNQTLTEEDIREEVDTFAFEGHDTTSMGMSWALYLIGLHKDIQETIHEELDRIFGDDIERPVAMDDLKHMEYLDRVLKESQRLYPSVPMFGRQLKEDASLCGHKIPKETGLIIITYILHRNENVFPNPEKFDPDRFLPENSLNRHPYAYIPFSAGPRNCIGQRFAVMEEKVVIANILRNYRLESLDQRDKVVPAPELILRTTHPIRIKLTPRS